MYWLLGIGLALAAIATPRRQLGVGVVERGTLTSPYLVQRTATHWHRGVDISAPKGTPIRSLGDGVVVQTTEDCERKGYGKTILVKQTDGKYVFYAHLDRFAVRRGAAVMRGQVIGYVGTTNCKLERSTPMAPHLHLEVHTDSRQTPRGHYIVTEYIPSRMDPERYLAQIGMPVRDPRGVA